MSNAMSVSMPRTYRKVTNEKGWIRVAEAARILNRTPAGIRKMIEDGRLKAEQNGGSNSLWFIDPKSIEKILADNS